MNMDDLWASQTANRNPPVVSPWVDPDLRNLRMSGAGPIIAVEEPECSPTSCVDDFT